MKVIIERDVRMETRDGTELSADIYRPDDSTAHPVLLARSPYGKAASAPSGEIEPPLLTLVERGYAIVLQDCRGTGLSDGVFRFYHHEGADGADAIQWCATQPWSSGRVGTFGGSYASTTQYTAAFEHPSALTVMIPSFAPSFYDGDMAYRGGALALAAGAEWALLQVAAQKARDGEQTLLDFDSLLSRTPLTDLPEITGEGGEHYHRWVNTPDHDVYWDDLSYDSRLESLDLPALHIAGWYDVFLNGTIANYRALRDSAERAGTNTTQQLVIGPWSHTNRSGRFAARTFGMSAGAPAGLNERVLDLLNTHLFDPPGDCELTSQAPVCIFVMGIDQWRDEQAWPLPDTNLHPMYLHPSGELAWNSSETGSSSYIYDPRDPTPTRGGQTLFAHELNEGPVDQRSNDARPDVLSFTSEPFTQPGEVTGHVSLTAFVSIDTPDTDLTAALIDVHPDGTAILLTDGILRLRYRDSRSEPTLMQPGKIYEVHVDLWATSNVFLPGHRVRLDLSSSNFPRYARNSNTGGVIAEESLDSMTPTTMTIHHSAQYPSHLMLPVIEREAGSA